MLYIRSSTSCWWFAFTRCRWHEMCSVIFYNSLFIVNILNTFFLCVFISNILHILLYICFMLYQIQAGMYYTFRVMSSSRCGTLPRGNCNKRGAACTYWASLCCSWWWWKRPRKTAWRGVFWNMRFFFEWFRFSCSSVEQKEEDKM